MKTFLGFVLFALLAAVSAFGQGSVAFVNNSTSRVWWQQYDGGTTTWLPVGFQFTAELMYAPDGTPGTAFDAAAVRIGATTTFGPQGGLFNGGGRTVTQLRPAGGFGLFQVRVWETAAGSDYRSALLVVWAHVGQSAILRVDTGDPTTVPPGTPTALTAAGLQSFCVGFDSTCSIPEPSTVVLTLCGLTVLVFGIRARKI